MNDDNEIGVKISADTSDLGSGMREAVNAVSDAMKNMVSSMAGAMTAGTTLGNLLSDTLKTALSTITSTIRDSVVDTVAYRNEVAGLARKLGESVSTASLYVQALDNIYVSTGEYTSAARGMTRVLKTNEEGLNSMGLVTRDANGNLRKTADLMLDGIAIVNSYREGTDRNTAAVRIFGRGIEQGSKVLKLNKEVLESTKKEAQELGLIVGKEAVEDLNAFKAATNDMGDAMQGTKNIIGNGLMQVITELAVLFRSVAPEAIAVLKVAVGSLVGAFHVLMTTVKTVFNVIMMMANATIGTFQTFVIVAEKALSGDFAGAKAAWETGFNAIGVIAQQRMDKIVGDITNAKRKIGNLFGDQTETDGPSKDGKTIGQDDEGKGNKNKASTRMKEFKRALQQMEQNEKRFFGMSIEEEEAFWQKKLQTVTGNGAEDIKLRMDINTEIFNLHRKAAQETKQIDEANIGHNEKIAMAAVEAERDKINLLRSLGNISRKEQLEAEVTLANSQYQIQLRAMHDRLALHAGDKVQRQKTLNEIEQIEQKHLADVNRLYFDAAKERNKIDETLQKDAVEQSRQMATIQLDVLREQMNLKKEIGVLSHENEIEALLQFEDKSYQIERKALDEKLALYTEDEVSYQQTLDRLTLLEQQHGLQIQKIRSKETKDKAAMIESVFMPVQKAMEKSITGMIMGTTTLKKAMSNIFQSILAEFISMGVTMALNWAKTMAIKLFLFESEKASEKAVEVSSSIATMASQKAMGISGVLTYAALAAAAAIASTSAIPIIGPALAPEVGAAIYETTASYAIAATAAGGYDIPAGVNPVTQLHAQEMVLPAQYANMIRAMTANGGTGGSVIVNVNTPNADSFIYSKSQIQADMGMAYDRTVKRNM